MSANKAEERSSRIIKNLPYLCSNSSSPEVVINRLIADSVITKHEGDEIKNLGTDNRQFQRIYRLVEMKLTASNTYSSLMKALEEAGQHHIVHRLADDDSVDRNIPNHGIGQARTTLAAPPQIQISDFAILAELQNDYKVWMKSDPRNLSSVDYFKRAHNQAQDNCFKKLKDIPADNKSKLKDDLTAFLKVECTPYAQNFIQEKQQQLVKDYKRKMNAFLASNQSRFESTRIDDAHNNEITLIKNEYDKFLNALPAHLEDKPVNFTTETRAHLVSIKEQNNSRPQGAVLGSVAPTAKSNASAENAEQAKCVIL